MADDKKPAITSKWVRKTLALLACTLLCTTALAQQKGTFTDTRDGKIYKTVKIGEQVWMAENLNYEAKGSRCYNDSTAYCDKYGRLYNWETAIKVCPKFWHLPNYKEWLALVLKVGNTARAGKILKAKNGWCCDGNGTDNYGFTALPGGKGFNIDGYKFNEAGFSAIWWYASEKYRVYEIFAYPLSDMAGEDNHWSSWDEHMYVSVRCVQD